MSRALSPLLALSLLLACNDANGPAATPTKADIKTAAHDAKAPPHGMPGGPHAGMPGGPHGGMPGGPHGMPGGPHGGMPPMMGAPPPKGPPRDVTISGELASSDLLGLALRVPAEWESKPPANSMRVAQWVLPGPGGDGELVVTRFAGPGGVEMNVQRWKGQFEAPEGASIDELTTVKTLEAGALKTTLVDISGRFIAAVVPGGDERHDEADYRMLAAIVEGHGDPYYFKAVGPRRTLDLWAPAYEAMIASFAVASADANAEDAKGG